MRPMSLALYIHWPFCLRKCPYCDFNSHVRSHLDEAAWEQALLTDMAFEAGLTEGREIGSIFFGGGTPSLIPPALVEKLIDRAGSYWKMAQDVEITLEANPSSVEAGKFSDLARAGVNRVSLGLQALNDQTLGFLGRMHSVAESLAALDLAQSAFRRVSFDLIYARPGQSPDSWREELAQALAFGTGHLSLYQLTIEPGTQFATLVRQGKLVPQDDDEAAELFAITRDLTASAGLPAYEVSNHARPGEESRHNLTYWRYGDYVGIGPGAHGRRNGTATVRHKKPENYLDAVAARGQGLCEERGLGNREQAAEAVMMGLRLAEGIRPRTLARRFDLAEDQLIDRAKRRFYREMGYLEETPATEDDVDDAGGVLRVTGPGMAVLDGLLGELVAADLLA